MRCDLACSAWLGEPVSGWDAVHLAKDFFGGLDGEVRVDDDTIILAYHNAPNESRPLPFRDFPPATDARRSQIDSAQRIAGSDRWAWSLSDNDRSEMQPRWTTIPLRIHPMRNYSV